MHTHCDPDAVELAGHDPPGWGGQLPPPDPSHELAVAVHVHDGYIEFDRTQSQALATLPNVVPTGDDGGFVYEQC